MTDDTTTDNPGPQMVRSKGKHAQESVSKSKPAKPHLPPAGSRCKDLHGCIHDAGVLRKRRLRAVIRGMNYMHRLLTKHKCSALFSIGDDAPSIFFEVWYTSANSQIRCRAKNIAVDLLEKYEAFFLEKKAPKLSIDNFFESLFLIRCKHEMDLDCESLLCVADLCFKELGLRNTDLLFEVKCEQLEKVDTDSWLLLLMRILIVEFMNLLFRSRFPMQWGIEAAFMVLREHKLTGPPHVDENDDFKHSFYLATHIAYATSAYSSIKCFERDAPWLYRYIRKSGRYWYKMAKLKQNKDPTQYVDVDGLAEVVDCLRGLSIHSTLLAYFQNKT